MGYHMGVLSTGTCETGWLGIVIESCVDDQELA